MNSFEVSTFLNQLYEDCMKEAKAPLDHITDWGNYRSEQLQKIRAYLQLARLREHYEHTPAYLKLSSFRQEDVEISMYQIDAISALPFPVYVLQHTNVQKERAVMILQGHDPRGAKGAFEPFSQKSLGMELAKRGYRVFVPELIGLGDAKMHHEDGDIGPCESCGEIEPRLLNCGLNLLGVRVWEAIKTIDFAMRQTGIRRITAYGMSGGGHVCNYVGVLDDRIDQVIISGYVNLYKYSTHDRTHCICNYVPGQLSAGESYAVTSLMAPEKKLFLMSGLQDTTFPAKGSREAFAYVEQVYGALQAKERFSTLLFEGGHEIRIDPVCQFLEENA
ncbi:MAG: alpha/beta hydrolase [Lachnospiraceae bacterium]|nr:alpha/beta hydrolase [Lachnospiraceae bacterium]